MEDLEYTRRDGKTDETFEQEYRLKEQQRKSRNSLLLIGGGLGLAAYFLISRKPSQAANDAAKISEGCQKTAKTYKMTNWGPMTLEEIEDKRSQGYEIIPASQVGKAVTGLFDPVIYSHIREILEQDPTIHFTGGFWDQTRRNAIKSGILHYLPSKDKLNKMTQSEKDDLVEKMKAYGMISLCKEWNQCKHNQVMGPQNESPYYWYHATRPCTRVDNTTYKSDLSKTLEAADRVMAMVNQQTELMRYYYALEKVDGTKTIIVGEVMSSYSQLMLEACYASATQTYLDILNGYTSEQRQRLLYEYDMDIMTVTTADGKTLSLNGNKNIKNKMSMTDKKIYSTLDQQNIVSRFAVTKVTSANASVINANEYQMYKIKL